MTGPFVEFMPPADPVLQSENFVGRMSVRCSSIIGVQTALMTFEGAAANGGRPAALPFKRQVTLLQLFNGSALTIANDFDDALAKIADAERKQEDLL